MEVVFKDFLSHRKQFSFSRFFLFLHVRFRNFQIIHLCISKGSQRRKVKMETRSPLCIIWQRRENVENLRIKLHASESKINLQSRLMTFWILKKKWDIDTLIEFARKTNGKVVIITSNALDFGDEQNKFSYHQDLVSFENWWVCVHRSVERAPA